MKRQSAKKARKGQSQPAKKSGVKPAKSRQGKADAPTPPPAGVKCWRIHSLEDLRRVLVSILNKTRKGEISESMSGKLTYTCNSLLPILEKVDLLSRLEALEKLTKGVRGFSNGQYQ